MGSLPQQGYFSLPFLGFAVLVLRSSGISKNFQLNLFLAFITTIRIEAERFLRACCSFQWTLIDINAQIFPFLETFSADVAVFTAETLETLTCKVSRIVDTC